MKNTTVIANNFKTVLKVAPFSALFTIFYYVFKAAVPVVSTIVSVELLNNAALVLSGTDVENKLILYILIYFGLYLINDIITFISGITINAGVYEKSTSVFRINLYLKMEKLPAIFFENAEMLNKKQRAEQAVNDETLSSIFNRFLIFLSSFVSVISVMVVLAKYSLWLLPISFLSALPYLIANIIRGREFYYLKRAQAQKARLMSYLWSLFCDKRSAKEMRSMGFDNYIMNKWKGVRDQVNQEIWDVNMKRNKSLLWCDAIRIIGYGLSIIIVFLLVVNRSVTIGVFGACLTAFLSVQSSMQTFLIDLGRLPEQLLYAKDYYDFLDYEDENNGEFIYQRLENEIRLINVSFKYPNRDECALDRVNLIIQKGEKIAVIGENGSGKTTLSKIILGVYEPESGDVLVDGISLSKIDKQSFNRKVSIVSQNFAKYLLTLRENVGISETDLMNDDQRIWKALNSINFESFHVDQDLDVQFGREFGGIELSHGQWQKIAIARGLFRDSEVIVLDEPTSALDPLIEAEILAKFLEMSKDKTAVIISHRVGLCKLVDRVVVMKNGKITETGTHSELIKMDGEYKRLYTSQQKWYQMDTEGIIMGTDTK